MQILKTSKDWEEDLYIIYLQSDYYEIMEFKVFIKYAKNNERLENILGYKWSDVKDEIS